MFSRRPITATLVAFATLATANAQGGIENILEGCVSVCPNNLTDFVDTYDGGQEDGVTTLKLLTGEWGMFIEPLVNAFSASRDDVNVEMVVTSMTDMPSDIINEATSETGLIDAFFTPPNVMGSIVDYNGWADLRDYIDLNDWQDIMLAYRKYIAQYQDQILMMPTDGDILTLFYNKEILENFGLKAPRTWEEYNEVAKEVHGQTFNNKTISGSCVGRVVGCAGGYWANLVLSSMTQSLGQYQGHLFDTADMSSLLGGNVFSKMLEYMEGQVKYGHPNEFEGCVDVNAKLRQGECALTYNWGNTFIEYLVEPTVLRGEKLGIANTPGSREILNRETMELEECDEQSCKYGVNYDDIGWVNHPAYAAFGGWSCAVNNYTSSFKKKLSSELCAFMASKDVSSSGVIPTNATAVEGASDPYRKSHLDLEAFVAAGYEPATTETYLTSIEERLDSKNVVVDARFPGAALILNSFDLAVHDYLNATLMGLIDEADRPAERENIRLALEQEWSDLIAARDAETSTRVPTLETYQRLRGVYTVVVNMNQLGQGIRGYGFAIAAVTLLTSLAFCVWTLVHRESRVVRASQPIFLVLICIGTFIFGSAIVPMSIDDGIFSEEACSRACMSIPFLVFLGWSIIFAALFAKLRRVNLVMKNARKFKRLKVEEKDVMLPFGILFTANLIVLIAWTATGPLYWNRIMTSETSSYGACSMDRDSVAWKICVPLLGLLNGAALVLANVEAYRARKVSTEFSESSYIGLASASMLQVFLVGIPLMVLVSDNPTATFFVNSSIALIVCMSALLLLFVPKIHCFYQTTPTRKTQLGSSTMNLNGGVSGLNFSIHEVENQTLKHKLDLQQANLAILQKLLDEKGIHSSIFEQAGFKEASGLFQVSRSGKEDSSHSHSVLFKVDEKVASVEETPQSSVSDETPKSWRGIATS